MRDQSNVLPRSGRLKSGNVRLKRVERAAIRAAAASSRRLLSAGGGDPGGSPATVRREREPLLGSLSAGVVNPGVIGGETSERYCHLLGFHSKLSCELSSHRSFICFLRKLHSFEKSEKKPRSDKTLLSPLPASYMRMSCNKAPHIAHSSMEIHLCKWQHERSFSV